MLGNVLTGLGNRGWGAGEVKNWIAIILMGLGVWLVAGTALWTLPVFWLTSFLFRMMGARPWLNMMHTPDWVQAMLRTCWVLPHTLFMAYVTMSVIPLLVALLVIAAIPAAYYFSYKIFVPKEKRIPDVLSHFTDIHEINTATSVAELLSGILLSLI